MDIFWKEWEITPWTNSEAPFIGVAMTLILQSHMGKLIQLKNPNHAMPAPDEAYVVKLTASMALRTANRFRSYYRRDTGSVTQFCDRVPKTLPTGYRLGIFLLLPKEHDLSFHRQNPRNQ
ncbi:MAG: hypothetical protein LBO79_10220 [Zoogloeaceae bacterium]|nr:hypothetical protein [Zoogloeaceae bacterium]